MFVRFRQSAHRLQLSLVETRRLAGKVRHEHVASLGAIVAPALVADRLAFWQKLHERLARPSNRIDAQTQGKILGAVHDRIPMVTIDEIRALQLENAEADERFWSTLQDMHESTAQDHTTLRGSVERAITDAKAGATKAGEHAAAAKNRKDRLKNGEPVGGGLGKPMTMVEIAAQLGWTASDIRHARRLAEIYEIPGGEDELMKEEMKGRRCREKAASLAVLKRAVRTQRNGDCQIVNRS
jgi:hypothetical protein